jgi:ParB/RepB/Spo0J family partition protein
MKEETLGLAGLRFLSNRAYGGEGEIQILAEDIKRNGLINPVTVKAALDEAGAGYTKSVYEVVAGRRRVQAAALLGWDKIPCRILEGDETERAEEIAGSENINRMAMHPLDEAVVFHKLIESGRPIEELAKQYDRPVSAIWQRVQLLGLSDGIKTLFRNGTLSLHAAAMLKSLDEKGQRKFYEKCNADYDHYVQKKEEIPIVFVRGFISSHLNDKLFGFIVAKGCQTCQKRTFYEDKGLFPELEGADDSCLDHKCYLKRWDALIAAKIKNCKKASPAHADTVILAVDAKIKKWLGKNPLFDGTVYEVRSAGYGDTTDKPGKNDVPCIMVELDYHDNLTVSARYWKDKTEPNEQRGGSEFAPIVKLLDLPKKQAAEAVQAFEGNRAKLDQWDINNKIQEKTFWRLMKERAKQPPNKEEVAVYLKNHVFCRMDADEERIFKLFTGKDYSEEIIPWLISLPVENLFFIMAAIKCTDNDLPSLYRFDNKDPSEEDFISWLGTTREDIKKIYQEEIKALMPKAKPPEDTGKPAKAKK